MGWPSKSEENNEEYKVLQIKIVHAETVQHYGSNVSSLTLITRSRIVSAKGVETAANFSQPRQWAYTWTGKDGMIWMCGGSIIINGGTHYLNDLWKFNPETKRWT